MTEEARTQIKTANGLEARESSGEQNLYSPCTRILDNRLALKLNRSFLILAAALLLGSEATSTYAGAVTPDCDEALIASLPENQLPELREILAKAMINAPRVIDSGLNLELAGASVKMARAPMLPNASGYFNTGAIYERYQYPNNPNDSHSHLIQALTYNAGVSQPIYRWGALKKGYQSAQLQRAIAERNIGEARRLLAIDVRRSYFNLIVANKAREIEEVGLANLEQERAFLKQQATDGFVTQSVANDATTRINDYHLQMRRSENNYQAQWTAFRQLTGIESLQPSDSLPKEVPAILDKLGEVIKNIAGQPGEYRPASLVNADDNVRSEQLNYEIVKTRLRPQLSANLSASQDNRSPDNNSLGQKQLVTSVYAFATVNWNIFDGFTTKALKQTSLIRLRQLKTSRDQAERDYHESLKNQADMLSINWESLQTTEVGLVSARSSVDIYRKDYETGFGSKKGWDDATLAADNALQAANNARADYYMQIVNYLSLRGKDPVVNPTARKQTSNAAKN